MQRPVGEGAEALQQVAAVEIGVAEEGDVAGVQPALHDLDRDRAARQVLRRKAGAGGDVARIDIGPRERVAQAHQILDGDPAALVGRGEGAEVRLRNHRRADDLDARDMEAAGGVRPGAFLARSGLRRDQRRLRGGVWGERGADDAQARRREAPARPAAPDGRLACPGGLAGRRHRCPLSRDDSPSRAETPAGSAGPRRQPRFGPNRTSPTMRPPPARRGQGAGVGKPAFPSAPAS